MSSEIATLDSLVRKDIAAIYDRATSTARDILAQCADVVKQFLSEQHLEQRDVAIVAVGSVGRMEALDASDLDVIPVISDERALQLYQPHDFALRGRLQQKTQLKVSRGEDLTRAVALDKLVDPESIGGDLDDSALLTKRILILTEGRAAGGALDISDVRDKLVNAYAGAERTSGRHVLSLCNDIARYYRTLCIEYKAKVDVEAKDWCTRNLKLRHSRKFWYFANMLAIAAAGEAEPAGGDEFKMALVEAFDASPRDRLLAAADGCSRAALSNLLTRFARFLDFMSSQERRESLAAISHDNRYELVSNNHFPMMKYNSDILHAEIVALYETAPAGVRRRMVDWFLL